MQSGDVDDTEQTIQGSSTAVPSLPLPIGLQQYWSDLKERTLAAHAMAATDYVALPRRPGVTGDLWRDWKTKLGVVDENHSQLGETNVYSCCT